MVRLLGVRVIMGKCITCEQDQCAFGPSDQGSSTTGVFSSLRYQVYAKILDLHDDDG